MDNASVANTTPYGATANPDTVDRAKATFLVVYYVFIIAVGVPGNCLILRVYWGKSPKCSTHILIMGLALADLIICLLRLWDVILNSSFLDGAGIPDFSDRFNCVDFTVVGTSIMVTAVIALDRYDCVCRPINRRIMTHRRARKALLASLATSAAVNSPLYVKVATEAKSSDPLDTIIYACQITSFVVPILMISVCYSVVFFTIRKHIRVRAVFPGNDQAVNAHTDYSTRSQQSLVIATVSRQVGFANLKTEATGLEHIHQRPKRFTDTREVLLSSHSTKIATSERKTGKEKPLQPSSHPRIAACTCTDGEATTSAQVPSRVTGGRRKQALASALQRRTTMMLFITSVVFVLCWLPFWVKALLEIFGVTSAFLDTFMEVLYLNNVINPFIYGLANRRFRKDCKDVFRKMRQC